MDNEFIAASECFKKNLGIWFPQLLQYSLTSGFRKITSLVLKVGRPR
jgi:hypothetical protein